MSRFTTSAPMRPHYESRPYRPSPGRRQHIHGRIVGIPDRRDPLWWRVISVAIMAACTIYALKLAVIG